MKLGARGIGGERQGGKALIDIHSHIPPGLDDGSPDMETSIKMAEIAVSEGITKMIATPHFIEEDKELDRDEVIEKVEQLNRKLKDRSLDLEIFPGEEVLLTPNIAKLYEEGKIITLCDRNKYILVELPLMSLPLYSLDVIYSLGLKGLKVIIAHPERNREIAKNPERLKEFIRIGALVQVNSLSLTGVFGRKAKRAAEKIINSGMTHIIATDCHTARSRSPRIKKALEELPLSAAELLVVKNPSKIIEGRDIDSSAGSYDGKGISFIQRLRLFVNSFKGMKEVKDEV
jgi:protein-tyrosine phosphatase